ncbi:MAG: EAL domain-containing protein [Xanthobacteraceae bacterium]|nr:EAL domain-containing protein [Xanthobacteraceae bacterium]
MLQAAGRTQSQTTRTPAMGIPSIEAMRNAFSRSKIPVREGVLVGLAILGFALVAYQFDVVITTASGRPAAREIELDEALGLTTLLCLGLLLLTCRFMISQRREMARRIEAERRARELSLQDVLTGLPNRRRFDQELNAAIEAPPRSGGAHALLVLDLNGFKRVNDVHGHGAGDEVLIHVSMRLQTAVRDGDLVVRLGGDEFAILARQLSGAEDATSIALRIIAEIDRPIVIGSITHQVGIGIGIALFPQDASDRTELLRKADIALYRAKAGGFSASRFFEPEMDARVLERDLIERELRHALNAGAIEPHFQPLIDLHSNRIAGFEALARWTHPALGELEPDRFIPIAESCGLINELTDHLLRKAAAAACEWPDDVILSFNISPTQIKDHTLGLRILAILGDTGLSPRRLEIELTEAALVHDLERARMVLGALRDAGVRIALDDFGTGYSSLYHLRNFKVDKIKIDRSFVDNMACEPEAAVLVRALLGLGHGLGLTITAEGIEHQQQATALRTQGCEQGQGYLYGHAMPASEALDYVSKKRAATADAPSRVA